MSAQRGRGSAAPSNGRQRPTADGSRDEGDWEQRPPGAPRLQIRTFEGDPAAYKEWRREVQTGAFIHNVSDDKLAGLVYLALAPGEGKPRDLFSHYEVISELCSEEGLK